MKISEDVLCRIISDAYSEGVRGSWDQCAQTVEDLLRVHQIQDVDAYRVWKVEELRAMVEHTIFIHKGRGRCRIINRPAGPKYMLFDNGQCVDFFANSEPWDQPMRLVHSPSGDLACLF